MKNILSTIQISSKIPAMQTVILTAPNNLQQAINNIQTITEELNIALKEQLTNIEEERNNCAKSNCIINTIDKQSLEQIPENYGEMLFFTSDHNCILDEVTKVINERDGVNEDSSQIIGEQLKYVINEVE